MSDEVKNDTLTKDDLRQQVKFLRYFREFTHTAPERIAKHSGCPLESIVELETDSCNPDEQLIAGYAEGLQKALGTKRDLRHLAIECTKDPKLLSLMNDYEDKRGSFVAASYKIASKIYFPDWHNGPQKNR